MSTVNDFPVPNGSRIKIVKLSEETYCIGEVELYNKKPCGYNSIGMKNIFKTFDVHDSEICKHNICVK